MNFITYITQSGGLKTALINGESPNFQTQRFIDEPYIVTAVFVDSVKQQIEVENPIQMAVVNDNFFDGDTIGVNDYNQAGYFSCTILESNFGSSSSDVTQLIPYLAPRPYLHRYSVPRPVSEYETSNYNPHLLNCTVLFSNQDVSNYKLTGYDMYSNVSYSQRHLLYYPDTFLYPFSRVLRFCDLDIQFYPIDFSLIPLVNSKKVLEVNIQYDIRTNEVYVFYCTDQTGQNESLGFSYFDFVERGFEVNSTFFKLTVKNAIV